MMFRDALLIVGLSLIAWSAFLVSLPLGLMVVGSCFVMLSVLPYKKDKKQ